MDGAVPLTMKVRAADALQCVDTTERRPEEGFFMLYTIQLIQLYSLIKSDKYNLFFVTFFSKGHEIVSNILKQDH